MSGSIIAEDGRLRFDGLETRLSSPVTTGDTTFYFTAPLSHSGGQPVPTIPSGSNTTESEYISLAVLDGDNRLSEIVHLVGYQQGAVDGTVVRGEEGTLAANHRENAKIVHAATVQDFLNVQEHANDPTAHRRIIESLSSTIMGAHLTQHETDLRANPHPIYIRKSDGRVNSMEVVDALVIRPSATLVVQGQLIVEGRLILNGYEIHVGTSRPTSGADNLIWIQPVP